MFKNTLTQATGMLMICGVLIFGINCTPSDSNEGNAVAADRDDFGSYWYSGEAEITRYKLEQARYGEMREGDAVLIFVTEDFLKDKQVKYEFGDKSNAVTVLKLNFTRKFYTGVYPYSMMTSVFTPVKHEQHNTLKVTTSSQEWCGHTFTQLNNHGDHFEVQLRSYFQAEGDRNLELPEVWLEDEIWSHIRLAPEALPVGEIEVIPGTQFQRFRHIELKAEKATASREPLRDSELSDKELEVYTLDYDDLERTLKIKYEKAFPHRILAWEETYPSGFGPSAKMMTTRAVKTNSIKSPYWTKNSRSDAHLRDKLGVMY